MRDEEEKLKIEEIQSSRANSWYFENKTYIKNTIISCVLLLMVYISIKIVSYLIRSDALNNFMKSQLESKKIYEQREKKNSAKSNNSSKPKEIKSV